MKERGFVPEPQTDFLEVGVDYASLIIVVVIAVMLIAAFLIYKKRSRL